MSKKNYNSAHSGTSWPVPYYLDVRVGRHAGRSRGGMTHARYGAWQETTVVFFRLLAPGPSRWSHAQWLHPAAQGGVCGVQSVKTKRSWKIYSAVTFTVGYKQPWCSPLICPLSNGQNVQWTKSPADKTSHGGKKVPEQVGRGVESWFTIGDHWPAKYGLCYQLSHDQNVSFRRCFWLNSCNLLSYFYGKNKILRYQYSICKCLPETTTMIRKNNDKFCENKHRRVADPCQGYGYEDLQHFAGSRSGSNCYPRNRTLLGH